MWRSLVVLFVVTTNLCTLLESYKISNDKSSRIVDASDQRVSDLEDGFAEELNYSNEEESYKEPSGRVVIGKWRNNGEAFEPKWRDGDSVPLAPFSTISFKSEWKRKGPDSREDHRIEPRTFYTGNIRKNGDFDSGESRTANKNENSYFSGGKSAQEARRVSGHKDTKRDRHVGGQTPLDKETEGNGSSVKYRETLQSYPNEYELFENENDDPRPRKRRPPENYEFPTTDERRPEEVRKEEEPANDVRRYSITEQDPVSKPKNQTRHRENVELKTFLKTQGSDLSLSEILQQKNLTLADILKGKPNAIKILKSNDRESSERASTPITESPEKITRISSTSAYPRWSPRRKNTPVKSDITTGLESENESGIETTTSGMTKIDNKRIAEAVDEIASSNRTGFVRDNETALSDKFDLRVNPSLGEENKSEDSVHEFLKPLEENRESLLIEGTSNERDASLSSGDRFTTGNNDEDEIMEFSDYPMKMPKFVPAVIYQSANLDAKRKSVPHGAIRASNPVQDSDSDSKLSIEDILSPDKKPAKIIVIETVSTVADVKSNEKFEGTRTEEEPKQKENLGDSENVQVGKMANYSTTASPKESESTSKTNDKNFTLNQKSHEVVIPKVDPESRAEILELFSSGSSAERLERLLASRNMTIEELIALRQRGSSQVHFAEVFKTKELRTSTSLRPDQKPDSKRPGDNEDDKNRTNLDNAKNLTKNKAKENFEKYLTTDSFDLSPRNANFRPSLSAPDKTDRSSDHPGINRRKNHEKLKPKIKEAEGNSDFTKLPEKLPAINNFQRDSEGASYYTSIETVRVPVVEEEVKKIPSIFDEKKLGVISPVSLSEIGRVEEIINNDLKSIKNGYGTNDYEYAEKKSQSKVKPSIIASGGILGVTIVVFLSIFIACRIRQKKKFTYKNSFAKAVFHNPVMPPRKLSNTSSVNTIMIDVVATSTAKRPPNHDPYQCGDFDMEKSDIDNDSLDANDSWDTIPDFMK